MNSIESCIHVWHCAMTHSCVALCHNSIMCVVLGIYMCVMTLLYAWHYGFLCEEWLCNVCDLTFPYVCHDDFIGETWLIRVCGTPSYVCQIRMRALTHLHFVSGLMPMCAMTHSYVTRFIHMCDMTHSYTWQDWLTSVTRLIHMSAMTNKSMSAMTHDSWSRA